MPCYYLHRLAIVFRTNSLDNHRASYYLGTGSNVTPQSCHLPRPVYNCGSQHLIRSRKLIGNELWESILGWNNLTDSSSGSSNNSVGGGALASCCDANQQIFDSISDFWVLTLRYFKRIWKRGQRKERVIQREKKVRIKEKQWRKHK